MSNYTDITFTDGTKQGLLFASPALEEFNRLMIDQESTNGTLQSFNVIYCGAYNFNMVNRTKSPDYRGLCDKLEDWQDSENYLKELHDILQVWNESRFGKGLIKQTENIKKKVEQLNQSQLTGTSLSDMPTEL